MHLPGFVFRPVIAAIAALTIHTQAEVPITRVYVPVVVFGAGASGLQDGRVSGFQTQDVTQEQIEAARELVVAAGIAPDRIQTWKQTAHAYSVRDREMIAVQVGILMIDLGPPAQARTTVSVLAKLRAPNLEFGWNQFAGVDCSAMERRIASQLNARARETASEYADTPAGTRILSLATTTDPRTPRFDPVPLCPADQRPLVRDSGGIAPAFVRDTFIQYASANIEVSYAPVPASVPPASAANSIFPFSTFGFPVPIIGHQNRAYVLREGRFAATPGASEVDTPADAALVRFHDYESSVQYASAVRALQRLAIPSSDYAVDDASKDIYIRLRPVTREGWTQIAALGQSRDVYRFVRNCSALRRYAHSVALDRSRNLAQAAAKVLHVGVGPLVVQTDWAGASTDATCGTDGSGDLAALIAIAKRTGSPGYGEPFYANFWDSIYATWTLGARAPAIVSRAMVERLVAVVRSDKPGEDVTGTATITPDGYFYTKRDGDDFTSAVVASKADAPKDVALGNVVTNCDLAQERALANAIRVAQFDGPVGSFYAEPARFLSIACLPNDVIGHSFSSLPTVYSNSSPTGAAQVTQMLTVYP